MITKTNPTQALILNDPQKGWKLMIFTKSLWSSISFTRFSDSFSFVDSFLMIVRTFIFPGEIFVKNIMICLFQKR